MAESQHSMPKALVIAREIVTSPARLFGLAVVALTVWALAAAFQSPFARALRNQEPVFGLVVGTDWVDNARHSDTMMLIRYDPARRTLDLLSIPRDTRLDYPGLRVRRTNEVYAYAYRSSRDSAQSCRQLIDVVRWLVFTDRSKTATTESAPSVPYFAQVDYDGFKKIVDLLGGIPVTVDEPMHYDDNWGKLHIHFEPGKYVLSGQKALEYVRYRGHSGDYGRVMRQQEFLLNVLSTLKKPINLLRLPQLLWESTSAIQTNLGWTDRFLALLELKDLPRDRIRIIQLPGRPRHGYWMPDEQGVSATAALLMGGKEQVPAPVVSTPNPSDDETADIAEPAPDQAPNPVVSNGKSTVEVWNASGKPGLALTVVRVLRKNGFDVVKWGNYSSRQKRTVVKDHRGDAARARALSSALNATRVEVYTRVEPNPLVDLEVILGTDYGK